MSNFFNLTEVQASEREVIWVLNGGDTENFDREGYNLSCDAAGIPTHGNLLGAEFKAALDALASQLDAEREAAKAARKAAKATEPKAAERTEGISEREAAGYARRYAPKGRGNEAVARTIGMVRSGKAKSAKQAAYLVTKAMKAEVTA